MKGKEEKNNTPEYQTEENENHWIFAKQTTGVPKYVTQEDRKDNMHEQRMGQMRTVPTRVART